MQSPSSIKVFCERVNALPRLDAVLANAGIMTKYFKVVEGYESTVMTNVIGTFLLAFGLLPKLRESAREYEMQPRFSVVASDLHFIARFVEGREKDIFAALNVEGGDMGMERLEFYNPTTFPYKGDFFLLITCLQPPDTRHPNSSKSSPFAN